MVFTEKKEIRCLLQIRKARLDAYWRSLGNRCCSSLGETENYCHVAAVLVLCDLSALNVSECET